MLSDDPLTDVVETSQRAWPSRKPALSGLRAFTNVVCEWIWWARQFLAKKASSKQYETGSHRQPEFDMPPRTLLSSEQRARLFSIPTDPAEMTRYYVLDADDLALVGARRRRADSVLLPSATVLERRRPSRRSRPGSPIRSGIRSWGCSRSIPSCAAPASHGCGIIRNRPRHPTSSRCWIVSNMRVGSESNLLAGALPGASWHAWRVMLIALCGEPLHESEREVFAKLTGGREREPLAIVDTFLAVAGRRSGKSRAMACLVVYLATCCAWDDCLALGERGLALFMAPTADQATVAFDYACALVEGSPILSALVEGAPILSALVEGSPILSALVVKRIADTLELILKLRGASSADRRKSASSFRNGQRVGSNSSACKVRRIRYQCCLR